MRFCSWCAQKGSYLSSINLIKPNTFTVYILDHHRRNLTAVSKVPWNEQSSAVTLSRYSFQLHKWVFMYLHKVFWNAYTRTILVELHNKYVTRWNVLESSLVCKPAWLSSPEISGRLYLQQLLMAEGKREIKNIGPIKDSSGVIYSENTLKANALNSFLVNVGKSLSNSTQEYSSPQVSLQVIRRKSSLLHFAT